MPLPPIYTQLRSTANTAAGSRISAALDIIARAARTMTSVSDASTRWDRRLHGIAISSQTDSGDARGASLGTRRITSWRKCSPCPRLHAIGEADEARFSLPPPLPSARAVSCSQETTVWNSCYMSALRICAEASITLLPWCVCLQLDSFAATCFCVLC